MLLFIPFNQTQVYAEEETHFAKITKNDVYLYSAPLNIETNKVFEIPRSYFVELINDANDDEDLFYAARYIDVYGYIKKSEVSVVLGSPNTPFANNISFRVFSPSGLDLKSSPNDLTPFNRIINIPYLSTNLVYYGKCNGEQMIPQKSSIWYYCKYIENGNNYFGYLYSDLCDMLTPIAPNEENPPVYEGEIFVTPEIEEVGASSITLSNEIKIIIVICASIPCFIVIYLLFKPTKIIADNGRFKKKKISKLKASEYYELED